MSSTPVMSPTITARMCWARLTRAVRSAGGLVDEGAEPVDVGGAAPAVAEAALGAVGSSQPARSLGRRPALAGEGEGEVVEVGDPAGGGRAAVLEVGDEMPWPVMGCRPGGRPGTAGGGPAFAALLGAGGGQLVAAGGTGGDPDAAQQVQGRLGVWWVG